MAAKRPQPVECHGIDRVGRTPLHYAAVDGNAARVKELLASGIPSGAPDDAGWTPLHFAAQENFAEIVQVLLDAGAPVDARDSHGNTPLSTAVFNSRGHGDVIKLLRQWGADPFAKNAHGVSPIELARTIANFDVRQFFNDLGET